MYKYLLLALPLMVGCESLDRITQGAESHPPQHVVYGDPHVARGITAFDHDLISGIPITDRTLTVKVKRPGESEFEVLNQFEYTVYPESPGIAFQFQVHVGSGGQLWINRNQPVAPSGTEYVITAEVIK